MSASLTNGQVQFTWGAGARDPRRLVLKVKRYHVSQQVYYHRSANPVVPCRKQKGYGFCNPVYHVQLATNVRQRI